MQFGAVQTHLWYSTRLHSNTTSADEESVENENFDFIFYFDMESQVLFSINDTYNVALKFAAFPL